MSDLWNHTEQKQLAQKYVSPGITTKDPCGSMETRQALRMEGESAVDKPHIRHASRSWRPIECSECSPSSTLQSERESERERALININEGLYWKCTSPTDTPFSSPWPSLPKRPITILHGSDVIWIMPTHHSHNFWRPILRGENLGRRALRVKRGCSVSLYWNWKYGR